MNFSEATFFHKLAQTTPYPYKISIERAEGVFLYSPEGKRYFDMISGIGVSNVGHRHPDVIQAIQNQLDKHLHVMVYGEFIQDASNTLAEKLTTQLPASLNCVYLVNSGTEANEGALKLAKRVTGRTEIISMQKSYHGSTHGSLSVSGNEYKKQAYRPLLPDVRHIRFNHFEDLQHISSRTACVIVEPIQGDAGVRIATHEWLHALRKKCDEHCVLLIFDEIQCGMGRTGKLFAFEHYGVVPDIITIGKAFGGGLPIGAFVADKRLMKTLTYDPPLGHITTFGGNPVCAAAAGAVLDVLTQPGLLEAVEAKGKLMESLLQHPEIIEIRRIGLMFAIDFATAERVNRIVEKGKEKGVICYWFLSHPHSFRLAPPLTITEEEIKEACALIIEAINETA
ncbi:MAG: aspartate aminotransferase family protein [Cyclobacteriaceae bacterium]|jgi:acetylornithine/succinyldiaminopimelate/putrescine aminotransferase|nr:aspartate aminotransferase family protein [Cyclobacteriaceae bacterium]